MLKSTILALILATTLLQASHSIPEQPVEAFDPYLKSQAANLEDPGKWIALDTGTTTTGQGEVLSLDSLNSKADFRIFDFGGKVCKLRSLINNKFYGFNINTDSQIGCAQSIISKINSDGQVLYISPIDGSYRYVTDKFTYSKVLKVNESETILKASAAGVDIGVTKTFTSDKLVNDSFRIFSKASDATGAYPQNFYSLVSNAPANGFVKKNDSSLTLKKTEWQFKLTSQKITFSKITAVNFVSVHSPNTEYEGQFIIGEDQGQPSCLFGVVDTYRFFKGKDSFAQMYAGPNLSQDFSCGEQLNYQGLVSKGGRVAFYYSINTFSGQIKVCADLPKNLIDITSAQNFGRVCGRSIVQILKLRANEYYSALDIIQNRGTFLTVVNIKRKGTGNSLRQVLVDFGYGNNLPTFDTDTYFYGASEGRVWRIRRSFNKGQKVQISYFIPDQSEWEKKTE